MERTSKRPGSLFVVGLGPGSPDLLTPGASRAIEAADAVVGYRYYLDLIAGRLDGKDVFGRDLGEEVERARLALEMAEAGRTVALISSGDAGIYGMGGVAWELATERPGSARIEVVPGVTAATAAAARLGAPLAHDWASLSLSDLLTPWDVIARRIEAAASADFVLAVYNPRSRTRDWQLRALAEILLRYRAPDTPVGLVENAYRPGERVEVVRLDELPGANVTMFTTVIVGSSRTFARAGRMVTPRIYAAKAGPSAEALPAANEPGDRIMARSLAIIDREMGPEPLDPDERAVVRRMIHASADFDFVVNLRCGPGAIEAAVEAFRLGKPVLTDVEMLRAGIRRDLAGPLGVQASCSLGDRETVRLAASEGLTRSAAGLRLGAGRVGDGSVVAIGNAPSAVDEALRLVEEEGWRPACIVGIPVGFVGVEEAKDRLTGQSLVPYVTSLGRKGGTAVTAGAVNALLEIAGKRSGPRR
jgi:precorrin-3B C17-methyltransferase